MSIYLPLDHILINDSNDDSYNSREKIYPNMAEATVSKKNGQTIVQIKGGEKLVYDALDVEEGDYKFLLKQDKCQVVFNKRMAKKLEINPIKANKGDYLSVSSYDEEPQHKINTIFVKIKGFDEYVTLTIDNKFSVYKMPKFKIKVPADGFELIK